MLKAAVLLVAAMTAGACATGGGVPRPRPFPGAALPPAAAEPPPPTSTVREPAAIISTALSFRGIPYRYGGSDPSGFDCSGFVQYVYAMFGTWLPREVQTQYRFGQEVDRDEVKAGDLVFFETVTRGASHVGLAIGGDEFVHAPSSRGVVRIEKLTASYWASRFVGARRVENAHTTSSK